MVSRILFASDCLLTVSYVAVKIAILEAEHENTQAVIEDKWESVDAAWRRESERLDRAIESMKKTGWEDKMGRLAAEKDLQWMKKVRQLEADWGIRETEWKLEKIELERRLLRSERAAHSLV